MRRRAPVPNVAASLRITWTPHADGTVQQTWSTSSDGGETWATAFDGIYIKRGQ